MKTGRKLIWGGLLIFLSIYLIADSFYGFEGPSIFNMGLSIFLGLWGITKLFDRSFVNASLALGFIGVINFTNLGFTSGNRWTLLLAAFLFGTGLEMIFKKKNRAFTINFGDGDFERNSFDETIIDAEVDIEDHKEESYSQNQGNNAQDFVKAETNFSDQKRYIRSDNFTKGEFETNFGNLELFFQSASFNPKGSHIHVDSNFGNVTMYFPRTVNVQNNLKAAMGSVSGNSSFVSESAPTVYLEGSANFGKISIRYL